MIIGDVVGLNSPNGQINTTPIIWVTGSSSENLKGPYKTIHYPLIQISPLADYSSLHSVIKKLSEFNWITFTSKYSVAYFFEQLLLTGRDVRSLSGNKIASVGKNTSTELLKYGIVPDIQPEEESSEGLLKEFKKQPITGKNILIPSSNLAVPLLPEGLTDLGNKVVTAVVYENTLPNQISIPLTSQYDAILFSSPSCVDNFIQLGQSFQSDKKFIVHGNQTFFKLISYGVKPSQIYTKEEFESSMFYI
jgi:uroporphyrinogen III methyltransferase/synthase